MNSEKYFFFWKHRIANWTITKFIAKGVTYNCGEQYMMHQKALFFNDKETAVKIMATKVPREQKDLGRQVKGFNESAWDKVKFQLVKEGLKARYEQDPELKQFLIERKHLQFVEASPFDRIWGIGYDANNAIANIDNWGENLLGKVITELAKEFAAPKVCERTEHTYKYFTKPEDHWIARCTKCGDLI
ncbi:MAG: NADAR family protein [Candidatus Pacearchaeota archaeon]|jgi:hypothetical protein|nr:NADAR family protein [Clostridia bacterium]